MCRICRHTPCSPSCPNAPEPKGIHRCIKCGYEIFEGDKYLEYDGEIVCEDCISDMSREELIEFLGEELRTA